jgi:tRNA threonylcarbamoyladenosine modification (KEOPS) complex Cgi121 subunit
MIKKFSPLKILKIKKHLTSKNNLVMSPNIRILKSFVSNLNILKDLSLEIILKDVKE